MKRNFEEWLDTMIDSIANFECYIDFETIYKNAKIYTDDAAYLGLIEVSYEKGEN